MSEHEPSEKIIRRLRDMDEPHEFVEITEAQIKQFVEATKRRRAKYTPPPPLDRDERLEEIRKLAGRTYCNFLLRFIGNERRRNFGTLTRYRFLREIPALGVVCKISSLNTKKPPSGKGDL